MIKLRVLRQSRIYLNIEVLFCCDAIYMLKDWGMSRGARIEYAIAKELNLKIFFEDELFP